MVALLRGKRERNKKLAEKFEASRAAAVAALKDLELDVAEELGLFGLDGRAM